MKKIILGLFLGVLCLLAGCGAQETGQQTEHPVRAFGLFDKCFDADGYYYISDNKIFYKNRTGEETHIYTYGDEMLQYIYLMDGDLYAFSVMIAEQDTFRLEKWNAERKKMEKVVSGEGAPLAIATDGDNLYYAVAWVQEGEEKKVVDGVSYAHNTVEFCRINLKSGKKKRLHKFQDSEQYNGAVDFCVSDDTKRLHIRYEYTRIQDETCQNDMEYYVWDCHGKKPERQNAEPYPCSFIRAVVYQNVMYGYEELGNTMVCKKIDLDTEEITELIAVESANVKSYEQDMVLWTQGEKPYVFLYSYSEDKLYISKEPRPESSLVTGISSDHNLVALDCADYTQIPASYSQDMADYDIADLEAYVQENYKEYTGELGEALVWYRGDEYLTETTTETTEGQSPEREIINPEKCRIADNKLVYDAADGSIRTLYQLSEEECLCELYIHEEQLYLCYTGMVQGVPYTALDIFYPETGETNNILSIEKGSIEDIAFAQDYVYGIARKQEETGEEDTTQDEREQFLLLAAEYGNVDSKEGMRGFSTAWMTGDGTVHRACRMRFDKREYTAGEVITVTENYETQGVQQEAQYLIVGERIEKREE